MIKKTFTYKKSESFEFIFDNEALDLLNKYTWHVCKSYRGTKRMYLRTSINGKLHYIHRFIAGIMVDDASFRTQVDHINGNTLDNRKQNLRICPRGMYNAANRDKQKNNTSGMKGVFKRKDSGSIKYRVCVRYKQKLIHFGQYIDPHHAAAVYNYAANLLFKDFAFQNETHVELNEKEKSFIEEIVKKLNHEYVYNRKSDKLPDQQLTS